MGFSNFMGLMGGMARAGEQVADQTLARMDASAIAKAREEAQLRLEQRTEQAAIAREGRVSSREDFTYKRGLMDEQAKLGEARQFATADEKRKYDLGRTRIPDAIKDSNAIYTGSKEKQEGAAKTSAETEKLKAEVAKIKKESEAIGAGGGITEPQTMARLSVGADMIKARFGMKLDKAGFMMDDSAIQDREGMDKALVLYENRVRAGEQPYAAYESVIKEYNGVASATKAASDERAQRGIDSLNKNKPTLRFKDYTREEFDALPKEEQDKAINQSKAPIAPKQSTPVLPPMATRKDGDVIEVGGVKRSWNSQANGGKGGWGVVQAAPVAPAKPRGLMPEEGAATMPQNTPETPSLADRAEAARQRMHELANKTGYINPDASPAAKEWDAQMRQKAIDDDAGAKARNANRAARPGNSSSGMIEKGNIDLNNRPIVKNDNGSISTVDSISANFDGVEVLIPRVVGDKVVSDKEAIEHYKKTGENLGKFNSVEAANKYAQQLHEDQAKLYSNPGTQKATGKTVEDIDNAVRALKAKAVTHEDRMAGIKELMQYPEFAKRYPGLADTYNQYIRSTKKGYR